MQSSLNAPLVRQDERCKETSCGPCLSTTSIVSSAPHDESFWTTRGQARSNSELAEHVSAVQESAGLTLPEVLPSEAALTTAAASDGKSSLAGSITSLIATAIGTGVLALPFAFEAAGPGLGGAVLVVSVLLSALSSYLLILCCDWAKCFSYEEIMIEAFGRLGGVVMEVTVLWLLLGAMTSLLVVTGDALTLAFGQDIASGEPPVWWRSRTALLAMDMVFVVLPLSCSQSTYALRYSNSIAVTCTSLTAAAIVARGVARADGLRLLMESPLCHYGFSSVQAAPIIMLSLGCQVQVPCVYGDLKGRSSRRMAWGLVIVGACCFWIYATVSILGIAAVKSSTKAHVPGNILDGFPGWQPDALLMRSLTGIAVTLVYPMLCLPCRSTLDHLCFGGGATLVQLPPLHMKFRHAAETISVLGVTFCLATYNTDLASVFGLTGATAGSLICYIMPPAAFLSLRKWRPASQVKSSAGTALSAVFLLVCTTPVMIVAVWQIYEKYRSGSQS